MTLPPITIDVLILVAFFLLNIIVGFRYRGKNQSFREYAIGDKKFSTATLTATIVATWMSGSALFITLENVYKQGLYYGIAEIIGTPVCLLITGYIVGPRMGKFLNNVSVPESLGKLYGKAVQAAAGIATVLRSTGYVAMQLQVIAKILTILFNYEGPEVVTIAAIIITLYALSGGVKAVTFTDVLQFLTFGTLLPLLALTIWNNLQNPTQVTHMFQTSPLLSFKEVVSWSPEFRNSLLFMAYLMTPGLQPQLFQRMVMARDTAQIKRSFGYAAIVCLGIELCMKWIAIMMLVDQPGLDTDKIMQHIVNTHTYPGLKGLLGIGIIALSMSTADSVLNSCAVIIANDILPPLGLQKQSSLQTAKWSTLALGTLGLVMALNARNLLQVLVGAANFYIPNVAPAPMLLAIFGFKTSRRIVLMAMGAGATATAACIFYFKNVHSFLPCLLANMITMVCLHYLLGEKGGWQQLDPTSPLALERAARRQRWKWRLRAIKNFKLYPYLQQNLPSQEGFYFFFGLYTMAATYTALYTIGDVDVKAYQGIYEGIYRTVLVGATAFLTFPIWPPAIKSHRFIAFFWPLGISAILFFAGTLLAIMSHFHHIRVMVMMINLLMVVLLLHWPLALFLAFAGIALAVSFFKHYTGIALPVSELGSLQLVYVLLLFTSLFIARKNKQQYQGMANSYEQLKKTSIISSEVLMETIHHRGHLIREVNMYPLDTLDAALRNTQTKEELWAVIAALRQDTYNLHVLTSHLSQMLHQSQDYMRLTVASVPLQALLQDVFEDLYEQNKKMQVCTHQYTAHQALQVDVSKVKQLLVTGLHYAREQQRAGRPVLLGLEDTLLVYPILSIPGYVKRVPSMRMTITTESGLPPLKAWYVGSIDSPPSLRLPKSRSELPITYNQQVVDAHYGVSELIESAQGLTQCYVIPVDVREVRPQTMDTLVTATTTALSDTPVCPEEEAFVQAVQDRTQVNVATLQSALQLIKQYHAGVKRKSGEPFYLHPIAVAYILLDYTQEQDVIIAALLHDTVEYTSLSLSQIALRFNPKVQRIVDGGTRLDSRLRSFKRIQLSVHENIRKLLEVKDERILYVKLADRLHNMRTIEGHQEVSKQKKVAVETLQFFVPMAKSLGLTLIAEELKKRSFEVLNSYSHDT